MSGGLLDTSVVMDWHDPAVAGMLPDEIAISAITAAVLAAGPHVTADRLDLFTRIADDFAGLDDLIHVVAV